MKRTAILFLIVGFFFAGAYMFFSSDKQSNENAFVEVEPYLAELRSRQDLQVATFAGGCFWCMEGPFEQEEGVEAAIAGFAGGSVDMPNYEQVIRGGTGHREAVQVFYDPNRVDYQRLLDIYWLQIDPTDDGGQFADRGEQYATAIFAHDQSQKDLAEASKKSLDEQARYDELIVTPVLDYSTFFPAEDYHQNFYLKNKDHYERYSLLSGRKEFIDQIKAKYANDK